MSMNTVMKVWNGELHLQRCKMEKIVIGVGEEMRFLEATKSSKVNNPLLRGPFLKKRERGGILGLLRRKAVLDVFTDPIMVREVERCILILMIERENMMTVTEMRELLQESAMTQTLMRICHRGMREVTKDHQECMQARKFLTVERIRNLGRLVEVNLAIHRDLILQFRGRP